MRELAVRFAYLFAPLAALLLGGIWLMLSMDLEVSRARVEASQQAVARQTAHRLAHLVQDVVTDVKVLAGEPALHRLLDRGDAEAYRQASQALLNFSAQKRVYDQIRYLDGNGREVVRVNYDGHRAAVVSAERLQDKARRYYFTDTFALEAGRIFISPMDLNVENGEIEVPYKPTIRIGTPVTDQEGRKRGIVLVNYRAALLLDQYRDLMAHSAAAAAATEGMLLNRNGFWLAAPDAADEWGFMLAHGRSFARRFPAVWEKIRSNDEGTVSATQGLYTYATVYPLKPSQYATTGSTDPGAPSDAPLDPRNYHWKVVAFRPAGTLPALDYRTYPIVCWSSILLLLLVAALTWAFARASLARRRGVAALAESESHLREITGTLAEGLYVADTAGRITYVNPEACRLLGRAERQLLGQHPHTLFHHHDGDPPPQAPCPIDHSISAGNRYRNDQDAFRHDDGTLFPVTVSASPILRDGRVLGSVVAFHDISERRRMESELEDHRQHLEETVATRTRKLRREIEERKRMEADLRQAKESAERASQAKSEFLAVMSHETRTPLNAILGMGEMLVDTTLDKEQRGYLEVQLRAGKGLLQLIDDILDMAKLESGLFERHDETFYMAELIDSALMVFNDQTQGKEVILRHQIDPDIEGGWLGDEGRLRQILINLIGNAIKFTPRGEVRVSVKPSPSGGREKVVAFSVSDTGIGIDKEDQERIFAPFNQVDSSYTRRFGGTGLGLAIVCRLTEFLNGKLSVESEPGKGSTFVVSLPLERIELPEAQPNALPAAVADTPPADATPSDAPSHGKGLKILLAEDAPDNSLLIETYLRKSPHTIHTVINGQEAVEAAKSEHFDLILMDIQMPVMDGHEATRRIRAWEREERREAMTIVALTAHALKEDEQRSLAAGCDLHLTKPIRKEVLIAALKMLAAA
ncbi:hypothetical protein JCM17961_18180 [Endothiovibrio diazotrophicus]